MIRLTYVSQPSFAMHCFIMMTYTQSSWLNVAFFSTNTVTG